MVFYGDNFDQDILSQHDLLVLDPFFLGDLSKLHARGSRTFGYVSLGEVEKGNIVYPLLDDPTVMLDENLNWPGSYRVDFRKPAWTNLMVNRVIPSILEQGFEGLFFDTLDVAAYLEWVDAKKFRGMRYAAIDLVRAIRHRFPDTPIIMNRGYDLLADVHHDVDAVLAESLLTGFDGKGGYVLLDQPQIDQQLRLLEPVKQRATSPLPILSLDYWNPDDRVTIQELYRRERELGHYPYVSTRALNDVFSEPQ